MIKEKLISIKEASNLLGVSQWTLRRYPESVIKPIRLNEGHRRYKLLDILNLQKVPLIEEENINSVCIYCRVSSNDQKQKGDLNRQKLRLLEFAIFKKYNVSYIFEEVGSGMNDCRCKLKKLFELVNNKKINKVLIEHKDRLTRFNFNILKEYFLSYNVEIEWVENVLNKSFEDELVEDIISIMASFSAKVYGKRSHKNKKAEVN